MKRNLSKLGNPIFLCCIFLLLLNDFLLKVTFYNTFTGKLSDFVGLFAFPYFFSVFYPKYKKHIHGLTIIGFVFWKSAFSQPLIDALNAIHIPINRTVDFTDNIALSSIFISYYIFNQNRIYKLRLVFIRALTILSLFAFCATTFMIPIIKIKIESTKSYKFDFTNEELVNKVNHFHQTYIDSIFLEKNYNAEYLVYFYYFINDTILFDRDKGIYYTSDIDTIGMIVDVDNIQLKDTVKYYSLVADFDVYATSDSTSEIKLNNIITFPKSVKNRHIRRGSRKSLKFFEKYFIDKL